MPRFTFLFVLGLLGLCAVPLKAQDAVLGQMYGNGVHAYFGQDYAKSHECFTTAIDGKTQDPRAYYFRGLALLKLGRPQEAETDFQRGAKLESAIDPTRVYNIARALERVQGSDRATLEKYRLSARMAVLEKENADHIRRYQETVKEQRDFLQKQSEGGTVKPIETPDGGKAPEVPAPAAGGATPPADPFSTGDGGKAPDAVTPPPAETPAEKPATKPAMPKPAAGSEDPFGAEANPAAPATPPATKPPPAAGGEDPFGAETKPATPPAKKPAPAAGGDDPFGAEATPKAGTPAAPATPPATKPAPAAGGDDPFGAEAAPKAAVPTAPATPAKKPDAKPAPAAGGDDPFGGAEATPKAAAPAAPATSPAKKPDAKDAPAKGGDDPFGGADAPAAAAPAAPAAPPAKKPPALKSTPGDDPFGG